MKEWTFLTNHGAVLSYIARQPGSTVCQIASATGITERALRKVIADLGNAGYISKKREGREFTYSVNPNLTLRHDTEQCNSFQDFLEALGWKDEWS